MSVTIDGSTADAPTLPPARPAPPVRPKQPPLERFISFVMFCAIMTGIVSIAISTVTSWDPTTSVSPSSAVVVEDGRELLVTAEVTTSGPATDRVSTSRLIATDLASGERAWTSSPADTSDPLTVLAASDGLVYAASAEGPVVVDAVTGEPQPLDGMTAAYADGVVGTGLDVDASRLLLLGEDGSLWRVQLGSTTAMPATTAESGQWSARLERPLADGPVPSPVSVSTDAQGRIVAHAGCPDGRTPTAASPAPECATTAVPVGAASGVELRLEDGTAGAAVDIRLTSDGSAHRSALEGTIVSAFDGTEGPGLVLDCGIVLLIDAETGDVRRVPLV